MALEPWYKAALPRKEVREGRSFNPDEFAIALEQVVAGTAPADYSNPEVFFAHTCFTRALREHAGMVLRRLAGETSNTSPVMTLVTQFGGGKTHALTALYHLVTGGEAVGGLEEVASLLHEALQQQRQPLRAGDLGAQVECPAQRVHRRWIHRTELATGPRREWRLAAGQPTSELSRRLAHAANRH